MEKSEKVMQKHKKIKRKSQKITENHLKTQENHKRNILIKNQSRTKFVNICPSYLKMTGPPCHLSFLSLRCYIMSQKICHFIKVKITALLKIGVLITVVV